jgi:microcystin-dependent protein
MAFWKWSRTASSNATADNTINWAEGMAPSAVNDSARAMMARLAEWRDDVSGTIATAGTSTAYTVASNQGFDNFADMNGAMLAFVPHTTNGATVTLNVDGLGSKPLRSAPGVELPSGVMVQGTPYVATYNNADGAWYLQGYTINPYIIPIGGLMLYLGATAPNSAFVLPFGQAISRTTYATLFALVGTTFGPGDGSTTFNVLDLRGRGIFGQDNMGGSAAGRITLAGGNFDGTVLGGTGGAQNHTLTTAEMPVHNHTASDSGHSHAIRQQNTGDVGQALQIGGTQPNASLGAAGSSGSNNGNTQPSNASITVANAGSGGSHTIMPPAMMLPYILRII